MTTRSSISTVLWIALLVGVVVTVIVPLAGLVVIAVVAAVAQVRGTTGSRIRSRWSAPSSTALGRTLRARRVST